MVIAEKCQLLWCVITAVVIAAVIDFTSTDAVDNLFDGELATNHADEAVYDDRLLRIK